LLEVTPKQIGQLRRDWYAIVDVTEVQVSIAEFETGLGVPHPPISAGDESVRSATA
jgi:hypothetical protein